jgi:hypothetical protein
MAEEYVYDKQRILIVITIIAIILGSGLIIAVMWPKPSPEINDVQTDFSVLKDSSAISDKYFDFFNGTVDTNNTLLYKINVYADQLYFMKRMAITLQVDENVNIVGVVITSFYDESNVLIGQNDIPITQKAYVRTVLVEAGKYIVYLFLDILESTYTINYNIRISE